MARLEEGGQGGDTQLEGACAQPAALSRAKVHQQRESKSHPEKQTSFASLPLKHFDVKLSVCQRTELESAALTA